MKIFHTSDWHLGHSLFGFDRTEEQKRMLQQMVDISQCEQPDLFLICGDIYHTPQPSPAVQTMFNETIVQLHTVCPKMTIVATAGNHDSGTKHEIFRIPWSCLNVYMIGTLDKEQPFSNIIEIPNVGLVIALPYIHNRYLQDGLLQQLIDEANRRNDRQLPIIFSAHTAILGADFRGHEDATDKSIGGIDAIDVSSLGTGYDYLALGHIHHPQFIHTGKHNARYCGSPLPVSFDEDYEHSVSIVEIDKHGEQPSVRQVPIQNPHPLTNIPQSNSEQWEVVKKLLQDFPPELNNYIRLNVYSSGIPQSELLQEAERIIENKNCKLCHINLVSENSTQQQTNNLLTVQEFQHKQPIDIAKMYAADTNQVFDDDMQKKFEEALFLLHNENL